MVTLFTKVKKYTLRYIPSTQDTQALSLEAFTISSVFCILSHKSSTCSSIFLLHKWEHSTDTVLYSAFVQLTIYLRNLFIGTYKSATFSEQLNIVQNLLKRLPEGMHKECFCTFAVIKRLAINILMCRCIYILACYIYRIKSK